MHRSLPLLALVLAVGCNKGDDANTDDTDTDTDVEPNCDLWPGDGVEVLPTSDAICQAGDSADYSVLSSSVDGRVISITLEYAGGDEDHQWVFCQGDTLAEDPPRIPMTLLHDANCDAAEGLEQTGLTLTIPASEGEVVVEIEGVGTFEVGEPEDTDTDTDVDTDTDTDTDA